jgi:hypothetical protein
MIARAKLGRFGKGRSMKSHFGMLGALDPTRHGGEIEFGSAVRQEPLQEQ